MSRFFGGFITASVLWAGALAGYWFFVHPHAEEEVVVAAAPEEAVVDEEEPSSMRRRRRRRGRRGSMRPGKSGSSGMTSGANLTGVATTGDDLGENGPREINAGAAGGEQQLSASQIEQGFDGAFGRIRRCFILAAGDEPVSGRLTFGLRIASSGRVGRVNLRGPRAVTTGEAGTCLRNAAKSIRFPSFDGPEMVTHYPITLE